MSAIQRKGGIGMKLFLKRDTIDERAGFIVFNSRAVPEYTVTAEAANGLKLTVLDENGELLSVIRYNRLMLNYFTIRCDKRFYVLIPCLQEHFAFAIYGSTYRFAGDLAEGSFSMLTADGEIVMTQKKCWCKYGEGYELNIHDEVHELFLLSVAVCADMYNTLSDFSAVPT